MIIELANRRGASLRSGGGLHGCEDEEIDGRKWLADPEHWGRGTEFRTESSDGFGVAEGVDATRRCGASLRSGGDLRGFEDEEIDGRKSLPPPP